MLSEGLYESLRRRSQSASQLFSRLIRSHSGASECVVLLRSGLPSLNQSPGASSHLLLITRRPPQTVSGELVLRPQRGSRRSGTRDSHMHVHEFTGETGPTGSLKVFCCNSRVHVCSALTAATVRFGSEEEDD